MTETTRIVFIKDGPDSMTAVLRLPRTLASIRELFTRHDCGPHHSGLSRRPDCTMQRGVAYVIFEQPEDAEQLARKMGVLA